MHIANDLLAKNTDDNVTVPGGSNFENICMSTMISVPSKDMNAEEAPFEAIRKLNSMIKCLVNKLPSVKIELWNPNDNTERKLFLKSPEDVDTMEKYLYDYNRFISPGSML